LLANHPLDCPICDQGGECDLQDQAMLYGKSYSDFGGHKRAVSYKYFGPLVETNMTRCIHCTRCVRFMSDVAGTHELGMVGRGEDAEIINVSNHGLRSELSGNIIDLCPVGALTSKPYAFKARSWELVHHETIDIMDALGSAVQVDCRGMDVMRILPRVHDEINETWISDKTRFAHDGLRLQRIDCPYVRKGVVLEEATWQEALSLIASKLSSAKRIGAIAGDLADCESMLALKDLMHALGSNNIDCRQDGAEVPYEHQCHYLFNSGIAGIDQTDFILLLGVNPRIDAPVLNSRILRRYNEGVTVASIGTQSDLTYPVEDLGGAATHDHRGAGRLLSRRRASNHALCMPVGGRKWLY
jgi:NADH-quinone oxidoreductase subunit G